MHWFIVEQSEGEAMACIISLIALLLVATPHGWAAQGWYLLDPPPRFLQGKYKDRDLKAPLRAWHYVEAYDTAQQCKDGLKTLLQAAEMRSEAAKAQDAQSREDAQRFMDGVKGALCIGSDDPRLK